MARAIVVLALLASNPSLAREICAKKNIELVVAIAAGTATDTAARIIAAEMEQSIGQPITVINRVGANGLIGARNLRNESPDGCTIGFLHNGPLVIVPPMAKSRGDEIPYDSLHDFTLVGQAVELSFVLVINAERMPTATGIDDVVAYARAHPGTFRLAATSSGVRAIIALLNKRFGIDIANVPYQGDTTALPDLLSGRIDGAILTPTVARSHIENGAVRAIAVVGKGRHPFFTTIPTFTEIGIRELEDVMPPWAALVGPRGLSQDVSDRLGRALQSALANEHVRGKLLKHGVTPMPTSRKELARLIQQQSQGWQRVIEQKLVEF